MKATAIYLRVSSTNGQKFDSQWDDLKRWVEANKPEKVRTYEDKFTGKTMDRPGMQKLMTDLYSGDIDTIVCWRLDRLGRTAAGLTKFFEDLLQCRCNLISLKDNLDLSTPAGRLNANIIASVAAYETEIRGERVRAGQQAAKTRGKRWGGSAKGERKGRTTAKVKSVLMLAGEGLQDYTIDLHFCNCIFRFSTEPVVFGSFPKFHKRNISTEIILKLACNFCRRSLSFLNYYCANIAADWRQPDLQNACNNYTKTTIASTISSEFLRELNFLSSWAYDAP